MTEEYQRSLDFWQKAFVLEEEGKEAYLGKIRSGSEEEWSTLAPSRKLYEAAKSLAPCKKILDYGCGHGWASFIMAKNGAKDITAVEVTESAREAAALMAKESGLENCLHVTGIDTEWLGRQPEETYDGLFCSNVIDIVPEETAEEIIRNLARVSTKDAGIVISMNYYMEPKDNPERRLTVKKGNHIYIDDILRMVSRSDEEWSEIFGRYFHVLKIDHFAWPKEETERRRIFFLARKV